ncbi:hypothetical protein [Mycobacterium sp. SMC-4]|uniref:hypothetical protein n=1 Tax=Mycobacterium sp. SMC-4 TaxID=2857059 RepID=UPI0021B26B5C|nr:hypothetical protein [Mycobacterium sp. SMC-4]UXA19823.1 hypothetical protein KXD98_09655 [Mycobacterium sp. SMC-4]
MAELAVIAARDRDPRLFAAVARLNHLQGHVTLAFLYRTIEIALHQQSLEDQ